MARIDSLCTKYVGKTINRLYVLRECGRARDKHVLYECQCLDCGALVTKRSNALTHNTGCKYCARKKVSIANKKHGQRNTRLYSIWSAMKARCKDTPGQKKKHDYDCYYKRGISVCGDWLDFENFYNWAIRNGYKNNLTIDRIDNNKGYCPENCRWVTRLENMRNKRNTIRVYFNNKLLTTAELSEATGIKQQNLYRKLHRGDYGKVYIG